MNVSLILGMISIIFISAALMMALISRNNFSKYKDRLIPGMLRNLVRSYIRKGGIYNKAEFETVSEEVLFKLFRFPEQFFLNGQKRRQLNTSTRIGISLTLTFSNSLLQVFLRYQDQHILSLFALHFVCKVFNFLPCLFIRCFFRKVF